MQVTMDKHGDIVGLLLQIGGKIGFLCYLIHQTIFMLLVQDLGQVLHGIM